MSAERRGVTACLPSDLYTAAQTRALDRRVIDVHGIAGLELMERAGLSALHVLQANFPEARRLGVLCGTGNNGGDGYVLARHARQRGLDARVLQLGDHRRLLGEAAQARDLAVADAVECRPFDADGLADHDVLVDGLLGTGLDRPVEGAWRDAIEAINAASVPVLALDIPSGLNADSGAIMGSAVRARVCVSFIALKRGLLTAQGPDCCGRVLFADLDVPRAVFADLDPAARRLADPMPLPPRRPGAHKGEHGHVLVVGGEHGYFGATMLAAEAAARCGAGLVSVATRARHGAYATSPRPEIMIHGTEGRAELVRLLARATVVVLGPGLGLGDWGRRMRAAVLESRLPLVEDADALTLLAQEPERRENRVMTPHPGEAGRLLGCPADAIQADRFDALARLQHRYAGSVVLKGAGTLVLSAGRTPALCSAGNPGLAAGGSGDVLSGVIAALAAQGLPLPEAAEQGVAAHASAGDRAAADAPRGLMARDLMPWLRQRVNR